MDALVYDIVGDEYMRVYRSAEMRMTMQMSMMKRDFWGMKPANRYFSDCIVFFNDEQRVLSALEYHPGNRKKEKMQNKEQKNTADCTTLYRAMTDISGWFGMSFHLLPNNAYGARCLRLLTRNTKREIYEAAARTDFARQMGIECRNGVLYVRENEPCEYLTCRIRTLEIARKKQKTPGSSEAVTVLCWPHQADFVRRFFNEVPCNIMEISLEDVTAELLL